MRGATLAKGSPPSSDGGSVEAWRWPAWPSARPGLADAHRRGAFAAQSVAHILDQRRRARKASVPMPVVLPDDPRVRDLRIAVRPLGAYDALARAGDKKKGAPRE